MTILLILKYKNIFEDCLKQPSYNKIYKEYNFKNS